MKFLASLLLILLAMVPRIVVGLTLDDYLERAAAAHPALARLVADRDAVAAGRGALTALPDPELRFGLMLESVETRVGPQRWSLGVRQSFPWFGTLGARGRTQDALVREADTRLAARRLEILRDVRTAWVELAWLGRAEDTAAAHLRLLTVWEDVARTRYAAGEDAYEDLMRIQMELGLAEDRLRSLRARRPSLATALNAAVGLAADTPVAAPEDLPVFAAPGAADELVARQRRRHPELAAVDARVELHEARADLAAKNGWPRLTLGVDYIATDEAVPAMEDSGLDPIVARFGLTLPLWRGRVASERAAAASGAASAAAQRRDLEQRLRARLESALFDHGDATRRAELYGRTLLPRAHRAFDALLSAYGAGEASFTDLIDVVRTLLEYGLARDRALADRSIAAAAVAALAGDETLTVLPDEETP